MKHMAIDDAIMEYLSVLETVRGYPYALEYDVAKCRIGEAVLLQRGLPLSPTEEHQANWAPLGPRTEPRKRQLPRKIRLAVFERDGATCKGCGCVENLSVDHIIAESRGGSDEMDNLQVLCRPCNSRKGPR